MLILDARTGGRVPQEIFVRECHRQSCTCFCVCELNASSSANGQKDTMTVNDPGSGYDILEDDNFEK